MGIEETRFCQQSVKSGNRLWRPGECGTDSRHCFFDNVNSTGDSFLALVDRDMIDSFVAKVDHTTAMFRLADGKIQESIAPLLNWPMCSV